MMRTTDELSYGEMQNIVEDILDRGMSVLEVAGNRRVSVRTVMSLVRREWKRRVSSMATSAVNLGGVVL